MAPPSNSWEAYLKFAILLCNEDEEVDFKLGRPLETSDLNNLSSENMLKIVNVLMSKVTQKKLPESKPAVMQQFVKYGGGGAAYDRGIDDIYHSVKRIFPNDGSDLFDFSVLLLPARNPQRTKSVIVYIFMFVMMCDEQHNGMMDCYEQTLKESEEKVELCAQIDALRERYNQVIQEREADRERIPTMEAELHTVQHSIRDIQGKLSELSEDVEKNLVSYKKMKGKCEASVKELELLKAHLQALEGQIVADPGQVQAQNSFVKEQFKKETERRTEIGAEMEKSGNECRRFENLILDTQDCIKNFEAIIDKINDKQSKMESYRKTDSDIQELSMKARQLKSESAKLAKEVAEKRKLAEKRIKKREARLMHLHRENENLKYRILEVSQKRIEIVEAIQGTKGIIDRAQAEMSILKSNIEDFRKDLGESLSQARAALMQKNKGVLQKIVLGG